MEAYKVVAAMATLPIREPILKESVSSLLPQVDRLFVYLNQYETIPQVLQHPKISVAFSRDYGDRGTVGKFWWVGKVGTDYYFTVDDDLCYPDDYVERLCSAIDREDGPVVVGVHGIRFLEPVDSYFRDRKVWYFGENLNSPTHVHALGTGTCAFRPNQFDIRVDDFDTNFMADIWLAVAAKKRTVPMLCVERQRGWLKEISRVPGVSLYQRYRQDDTAHTDLINQHAPWPSFGQGWLFVAKLQQKFEGVWAWGRRLKQTILRAVSKG